MATIQGSSGMSGQGLCLVTGANGFIGSAVVAGLRETGLAVRLGLREDTGDIGASTIWSRALTGVDTVVHTAGRAHIANDESDLLMSVNAEGSRRLARQAAEAGVRRFVFISTIGVHGAATDASAAFRSSDPPSPCDAYSASKWQAELWLNEVAASSDMELVVIRPPLVHGPGVVGNFRRLLRWVASGTPVPVGAVSNLRSFVGLDNLVHMVRACLHHPAAAGQVFLVSDGEDVSTPDLVLRIALHMQRRVWVPSIPLPLLCAAATVTRLSRDFQRLTESLRVDIQHTRQVLDWEPVLTLDEGLKKMVDGKC